MAEITLHVASAGSGGAGLLTAVLTEVITVPAMTTNIVVTINGGFLPLSDDRVRLAGPTGPLLQGAGTGMYSINRAAVPNEIDLVTAPLAEITLLLQGIYP